MKLDKKPETHKKVSKNKDFCNFVMPSRETKISKFNQHQKSDKTPFIIYADLESLIDRSPEKSSTTKVGEHIPSGFPLSTILLFKDIENKHDVYRGKNSMITFCESLKEQAMKISSFKKKK